MVRVGGQKTVVATFRHGTFRNLDPRLHTHCVIANMAQDGDGKLRTTVNDGVYFQKMTIDAIYRAEFTEGFRDPGYEIETTLPVGRFEIRRRGVQGQSKHAILLANRERDVQTPRGRINRALE